VRDDQDNSASFLDCPRCGAAVRPGSVWFGEPVDDAPFAHIAAFAPDGCLVIGSSHLVQPAAGLPIELALAGRPVVDVNPADSPLAQLGALLLQGRAVQVLPPLVDLLSSAVVQEQLRRRSG
jgi:NAD-dependent deacetylase